MQSIEVESNTRAAQSYTDSFFSKLPLDLTKNNVKLEKILPATSLKGNNTIVFNFPVKVKNLIH